MKIRSAPAWQYTRQRSRVSSMSRIVGLTMTTMVLPAHEA